MDTEAEAPELPTLDEAAGERTTLVEMLDYYRAVVVRKVWGLTDTQLATTIAPSDLTLGGLLLHLALVEDDWLDHRFLGNAEVEPWASAPWEDDRDWEHHIAASWSAAEILSQYRQSVARSRAVVSGASSLDALGVIGKSDGTNFNLRWILVHLVEEYARHCGHADFIRQGIDGATGD